MFLAFETEMGAEQRETQAIEQFVKRASDLEGSSLVDLIIQATSHSSLFAFSEILAVPSVVEVWIDTFFLCNSTCHD